MLIVPELACAQEVKPACDVLSSDPPQSVPDTTLVHTLAAFTESLHAFTRLQQTLLTQTPPEVPYVPAPVQAPRNGVAPETPAESPHTLGDLLTYYLKEVLPALAPKTQYQRRRFLANLDTHYGHLPLTALTPAWLRAWRDDLCLRLKPDTVRQYLDTVSGLLTVAVNELHWLPTHPLRNRQVRKPPKQRGRVRFLSAEEQTRLLDACRKSRQAGLYPLVLTAMTTGARRGELFSAHWLDVDLERGWLRLTQTKNRESRAVPLPRVTIETLQPFRQGASDNAHVFPRSSVHNPFPYEYAWAAALLRAGLAGGFRFHDLRHTAASYLAMSGATLIEIAEILGHKTLQMVRRYSHFTNAHTQGVVERMAQQFVAPQKGDAHA
jgi:integrase